MSRCPKCNACAFRLVSKEQVASRVPERVSELVDEFYECGECLQVFWMVGEIVAKPQVELSVRCMIHVPVLSNFQGPKSYSAISLIKNMLSK